MAKTSTCKHCGRPIIFEPYFVDGKPGPNPPIWFHPPGVIGCNIEPFRLKAEPVDPATSDATPDTPPGPREVAAKTAIDAARAYAKSIERDLWAPRLFATAVATKVVDALADAGLLVLPDEGSLRSQASGGPAETIAEALRGVQLNLGPNALEAIYGGSNHLILSGAERRDIGLIAAKALGLEDGR